MCAHSLRGCVSSIFEEPFLSISLLVCLACVFQYFRLVRITDQLLADGPFPPPRIYSPHLRWYRLEK